MSRKHYSPAEIKQHIREQAAEHKMEAVRQVSDEIVRHLYAALALAIMEDGEDPRGEEEKAEYIQKIFIRSSEIWDTALKKGKAYRVILKELREKYGIVIPGIGDEA